jgi:pimeloyl-ACP methyl ester carboxylesterase
LVMVGSTLDGAPETVPDNDPVKFLLPIITDLTAKPNPSFSLPTELVNTFVNTALGPDAPSAARETWIAVLNSTYSGEAGRIKLRQATTMSLTRDSLHLRASDLKMPILWIQGSEDVVISPEHSRYELGLTGSVDPRLEVVQGGPHSCHTTHPQIVNPLLREFVVRYGGKVDAKALREAVGTVDI